MGRFCLIFSVLAVAVLATVIGQTEAEVFMFDYGQGSAVGDSVFDKQNDISKLIRNMNTPFTFYGKKYRTIYINENGLLSFVNKFDQYDYEPIPLQKKEGEEHILIAPFFADVDLTVAGSIYYRLTADPGTLGEASRLVRQHFVRYSNFHPKKMLIVTWAGVGDHGDTSDPVKENTFQCAVASDAVNTFVFFFYRDINWDRDVQIGFDSGDGRNSYLVDLRDFPRGALDLPQESNLDKKETPGVFIYRVTDSEVYYPECRESDDLLVYPTHASMRGGSRLTFGGKCFDASNEIMFQFKEVDSDEAISATVPCTFVSKYKATCIMPMMDRIGHVRASLSLNGGLAWSHTLFTIMPIDSETPGVMRTDPWEMKWFTKQTDLKVTWDSSAFDDSLVTITILSYREENETTTGGALGWTETELAVNVSNSGRYIIPEGINTDITSSNALGIIRIAAASKPDGLILSTDVHFLGYLLSDEGFQEDPVTWSNDYCASWYEEDQKKPPFVQDLNVCPCTLSQALADKARFVTSPYCDSTRQTAESLDKLEYCFARPGIKHCVLGIVRNPSPADSECCYDGDDNLVYAQDSIYGSFSNRISRYAGKVPGLSGAATDLVPYIFCNIIGKDKDNLYRMARPTRDCKDYEPVRPAMVFGDPHFVTLDNASYTFNGLGEYILLKTKGASQTDFRLQGRFERVLNADDDLVNATVLTALVMRESEKAANTIQIDKNDITMMTLKVGEYGREQDVMDSSYQQYEGFTVFFPNHTTNGVVPKMVFQFKDSHIGVVVEATANALSAMILLPNGYKGKNEVTGLFGNWNEDDTDDLQTPDGRDVSITASGEVIFSDFGQKWEVEESLFFYSRGKGHDDYQDNEFRPLYQPPSGLSERELNKVCNDDKPCRFDYQVTKNKELATQTARDSQAVAEASSASEKLLMCPFLTTPAHGTKEFVDDNHHAPGSKIRYACSEGYIFLGESQRECSENGKWSDSSEPSCFEVKCGTLTAPEFGSMEVTVKGDVITATFTCEEGVPMEGSTTRTCGSDKKWTGEETRCLKQEGQTDGASTAVIVVVVIIVIIVVVLVVGLGIYFYKKKQTSGGAGVTRPPDSAYQPVETKAAGEGGDVEMGTKDDKAATNAADDDGGFKDQEKDKE